jgi:hypothetical protein
MHFQVEKSAPKNEMSVVGLAVSKQIEIQNGETGCLVSSKQKNVKLLRWVEQRTLG